jgi:hypothetical protein
MRLKIHYFVIGCLNSIYGDIHPLTRHIRYFFILKTHRKNFTMKGLPLFSFIPVGYIRTYIHIYWHSLLYRSSEKRNMERIKTIFFHTSIYIHTYTLTLLYCTETQKNETWKGLSQFSFIPVVTYIHTPTFLYCTETQKNETWKGLRQFSFIPVGYIHTYTLTLLYCTETQKTKLGKN